MNTQQAPGYIKVPKEKLYERYPDLDVRILCHIQEWRHSVEVGTIVSVADMMNFKAPGRHGMPVETVMAHLFPPGGKPCQVDGVKGVSSCGPLLETAHGMPKYIKRTA